jgi:hypothetical protein
MGFWGRFRKSRYRATRRIALPGGRPGPEWFDVGRLGTREEVTSRLNEHAKAILQLKGREGFIPWTLVEPARGSFGHTSLELEHEVLWQLNESIPERTVQALSADPGKDLEELTLPGLPEVKSAIPRGDIFFIEGYVSDGPRIVAVVVMT